MTYFMEICEEIEEGAFSILSEKALERIKDLVRTAFLKGFESGYEQKVKESKKEAKPPIRL